MVTKSDGTTQAFDRDKIHRSMRVALRKRPVTLDQIEKAVTGIVRQVESSGETETTTQDIGHIVMNALVELDIVGYIRYASVYKDFREPEEFSKFVAEIQNLQNEKNIKAE
jgi:transcriptional repressor NrdR